MNLVYPEAGLALNWIWIFAIGPFGSAKSVIVTSKSPLAKNVAIDCDASGIINSISCKLINPDFT